MITEVFMESNLASATCSSCLKGKIKIFSTFVTGGTGQPQHVQRFWPCNELQPNMCHTCYLNWHNHEQCGLNLSAPAEGPVWL
jgi:hypothetical protein